MRDSSAQKRNAGLPTILKDVCVLPRGGVWESCIGTYGCYNVASSYAGLMHALLPPTSGEWQHGWIPKERNFDPDSIIGSDGRSREKSSNRFRVWRQDQAEALREFGFENVIAIGAPWVYLLKKHLQTKRLPNSLLVMPAHALPENQIQWAGDEYAKYIGSIRKYFDHIAICIHPACIKAGNWIRPFQELKVEILVGADPNSSISIPYLSNVFQRFEYVTGNHFGSFLAYAAYFGAKPSVAGPQAKWAREELEKHMFYQNATHLIDRLHNMDDEFAVAYPHLFVDPWRAQDAKSWGDSQLGLQNRLTREEMREEFNWRFSSSVDAALRRLLRRNTSEKTRSFLRRVLTGEER